MPDVAAISRAEQPRIFPGRASAGQIAFCLVLGLFAALCLWTLDLYPTVWFDEVEIVSAARSAFPGPPSMSTLEISDGSRPTTFTWAHALVMQPFFQAFGLSPTAARLSGLLGGLLAVVLLRLFLRQMGVRPAIATIVALLMLTDALFAASLRSGRADTLAFCWALVALLLIARANYERRPPALMACAGACSAASLLTWPSAAFLLPLIAVPLMLTPGARSPRGLLRNLLILSLSGGLVLAVAALAAFWPQTLEMFLATQRSWAVAYEGLGLDHPTFIGELMRIYQPQPWMLMLFAYALLLAVRFPSWPSLGAAWALGVALLAIAISLPYVWRYLYALPAILLALALGSEALLRYLEEHGRIGLARLCLAALLLCVIFNFVSTPVSVPLMVVALPREQRAAREYSRAEAALDRKVAAGERVFSLYSAFYAVENAGGHCITRFHIVRGNGILSPAYQAYQVQPVDGYYQILDDDPAAIDFLRTLDVIVAPYQTASARELVSADRTVRFGKVAELPDYLGSPRSEGPEGFWDVPYSFAVFRRLR